MSHAHSGLLVADDPAWLRPRWFLIAIVCGFLLSVGAGYILSSFNPYGTASHRFGGPASFTALHFPSARQIDASLAQTDDPTRIAVVVGGDSRMYSSAFGEAESWTHALQGRLGSGIW